MLDAQELLSPVITVRVSDVKDDLRLQTMHGREALGSLFEYHLDLVNWSESDIVRNQLAPEGCLGPEALLGKSLTVALPLAGQKIRHINGLVTQATFRESIDHHTAYAVTIRPRLWLLTLSQNCRVFQNMDVLNVVQEVLNEQDVAVRFPPPERHRTWDTLTQYRESDFDFITRLLAHEGFHYFFEHRPDGHTLVIAETDSAYQDASEGEPIAMGKPKPIAGSDEHLRVWQAGFGLQTEAVTLADFDFRLRGQSTRILGLGAPETSEPGPPGGSDTAKDNGRPPREVYDFPAGCVLVENEEEAKGRADPGHSRMEADRLAGLRRDARRCQSAGYEGRGTVRWLAPGTLFCVEGCGSRKFLATDVEITLRNPAFLSGDATIDEPCEIVLKALDTTTPFRLPPMDKPRVIGPQTAWVVGAEKEEISTDKYGRIQVHFHWDRRHDFDKNSSCWVRVAQPWAGNRWGSFSIPRVGSEVVVEFLYGDPDRPLVTGSVYGGENLPPYDLPEHKTRSGIKTRSSKGATPDNYNEIRFEDAKGKEELHLQAERDLTALVKHDQTVTVNGKRDITVKNGDTLRVVGSSRSVSVEGGYCNLQVCTDFDPKGLPEGTVMVSASNEIRLVCGDSSLSLKQDGTIEMMGTRLKLSGAEAIEADGGGAALGLAREGEGCTVDLQGSRIYITATQTVETQGSQVTLTGSDKIDLNGNGATVKLSKTINAEGTKITIKGDAIDLN